MPLDTYATYDGTNPMTAAMRSIAEKQLLLNREYAVHLQSERSALMERLRAGIDKVAKRLRDGEEEPEEFKREQIAQVTINELVVEDTDAMKKIKKECASLQKELETLIAGEVQTQQQRAHQALATAAEKTAIAEASGKPDPKK